MSPRPPAGTNDLKSPLAIAAICAMLLPILAFYGILARYVVNIPYYDDYQGVLEFLEHYVHLPTAAAKWGYILTAQHNEYKTIFANTIIALQYQLSGHPNFIWLSWVGNVFVFGLFYLLWRHFLPDERTLSQRLLFFVPVAYLLFQLQYAETLNWSMPGLQNVPVLIFAFATISCLVRESSRSFLLAALFMALTIAASGNGFALFPIGILILIRRKPLARIGAWIAVTALCAAIYFHHYDFHSSQQVHNGSVLRSAQYLNPIFTLSFMGSALGNYVNRVRYAPMLLGIAICCVLVLMIKSRYDKRNPAVFYFSSWCLRRSRSPAFAASWASEQVSPPGTRSIRICCSFAAMFSSWRLTRKHHKCVADVFRWHLYQQSCSALSRIAQSLLTSKFDSAIWWRVRGCMKTPITSEGRPNSAETTTVSLLSKSIRRHIRSWTTLSQPVSIASHDAAPAPHRRKLEKRRSDASEPS